MIIQTRTEYDSIKALRFSSCRALLKSPAHYLAEQEKPREETKALKLGSAIHHLVLQSDFADHYAIAPGGIDKRTSAGKAAWAEFQTLNAGKTILDPDDAEVIAHVSASMKQKLKELGVSIVQSEMMIAVDYCGCPIKSAIDIVGSDGYLWDLKTTSDDASGRGFLSTVRTFRYNLQAHFYRTAYEIQTGERPRGFRFLVTEKEPPYLSAVYELGPNLMSYAIEDFEKATKLYSQCVLLDQWPGYPEEPQVIDVGAEPRATQSISFA